MSDIRSFSKAFMAEFIELYKSYPCLWKTKSRDYKDRNKKDAAYKCLLKKIQEIEPNATKKDVTAKIGSMRGSFRREMKKIENSKRSGAGADEIYATHLWYYDLLLFTKDQEMPRESVSNLDDNREGEDGSEQETDDEGENTQEIEHVDDGVQSPMSPPTRCISRSSSNRNQHISSPSTSSATNSTVTKRKRKTKVDEQSDEILTMLGERLRNNTTNNDDAFEIFGKHVAAKLRTLSRETKIYTEKLINDLLFEAEMGNIDKNSKIVTLANEPTQGISDEIRVHGYPRNFYSSYLQANEHRLPTTYQPIHAHQVYQSSQSDSARQLKMTQQQPYHNLQSAAATPQSDRSAAAFYENYEPTEDNH